MELNRKIYIALVLLITQCAAVLLMTYCGVGSWLILPWFVSLTLMHTYFWEGVKYSLNFALFRKYPISRILLGGICLFVFASIIYLCMIEGLTYFSNRESLLMVTVSTIGLRLLAIKMDKPEDIK